MAASADESRVTLATVAQAAGVSVPTVSKVINGRADVAPKTRAEIERLLREHQYVPRTGRPRRGPARVLDLVFDGLESWYSLEIIRGVTEAAAAAGADVVVGRTPDDPAGMQWARRLAGLNRLGVIVVTSSLTSSQWHRLREAKIPLVVIDPDDVPDDVASVGATNWVGGLSATEHLLGLGHRRIAVIGGRPQALCSRARIHGFRAAMDSAGLTPDPTLMRDGDFGFELAYRHALDLIDLPEPPTAIFACSDFQAFGVVEAARMRGLRVPEDLSVVGFDDLSISRWAAPPLTTVHQPLVRMGRVACQALLQLADGQPLDSQRVELATHLVVRESTAAPKGRP